MYKECLAIAETVKGMSPMELAHTVLDAAGMINGIGEICDATNAVLYLMEKDYANAAMSAVACIPFLGNAATGAKWIGKGANAVDAIADTAKALDKAMDTVEAVSDGTRVASNIADVSGAIVDGSKAVGNVVGNIPTLELPKGNFAKELYEGLLGFVSMPFVKLGDNIDTAADTAKAMDKLNDAEKAGDALDAVGDVSKKTGDVADTVGDVSKRTDDLADTAGDVAKKADTAPAKNNGADDAVENANDAAKPKETLEEVGKIEDNGGVEGGTSTQGYSNFADGMSPEDAARYIENNEKAFFNEFSERASTAGLSDTQIAEAFEAMRNGDYAKMATYFDTSSPVDGAVFWSGNKEGAAAYANSIGGIIMEQTPGGQVFDNWRGLGGMYPEWDTPTNLAQKPIWDALSSQYANGAERIATYAHPDGYVGKVWSNIEKPILEENDIIIQEVIIDAK